MPDPAPLTSFRGQPLTHEVAEDLFVGWLQVWQERLCLRGREGA